MGLRAFGPQTIGSGPQPAFGSKVATAVAVIPDPHTGMTDPRSQPSTAQVVVTTGTGTNFRKNDRIMIGVKGGPYDSGKVLLVSGDTLTVQGLTIPHAVGEFIVLTIDVAGVYIRSNGSTLYLGEDTITASATSVGIARYLLPGEAYDTGDSGSGNVLGTGHYWIWGTAADTFLPSVNTI